MTESGSEHSGERLRVAFHCAPARPSEDRRARVGGRARPARAWMPSEAEHLEADLGCFVCFVLFALSAFCSYRCLSFGVPF